MCVSRTMRLPTPLKLVRDRTALFFLTWIPMHKIDETSPFHGEGAIARLHEAGAQLILSLRGTDETLASSIHARHVYSLTDIVVGARFADILQTGADGTREIDYTLFDEVVPIEASLGPGRGPS